MEAGITTRPNKDLDSTIEFESIDLGTALLWKIKLTGS